jgi:hypothetical protein
VTGEFNNDNLIERTITWFADPVMGDEMVERQVCARPVARCAGMG